MTKDEEDTRFESKLFDVSCIKTKTQWGRYGGDLMDYFQTFFDLDNLSFFNIALPLKFKEVCIPPLHAPVATKIA
jgi:hypothetical protein